jgi:exonuclease III
LAEVDTKPKIHIAMMHIPNMHTKLKIPYHQQVLSIAQSWRRGAGLLIGDTNSGLPDIDEESPAFGKYETAFMHGLDTLNWKDMFRKLHGQKREYTWYSPNGKNGFRLDEAFANGQLQPYITGFKHVWGHSDNHRQLSDHAAILLDTKLQTS